MFRLGLIDWHPDGYTGDRPGKTPQLPDLPEAPDWFEDLAAVQVAPSQPMITTTRSTALEVMQWGIRPKWGGLLINARGETVDQKKAFRYAVRAGQFCITWVSGWFEWQKTPTGKRAHHLQLPGRRPLGLASVWVNGDAGRELAIVTTAASPDMAAIHDRMPFALHPSAYRAWLQGELRPEPPPAGIFEAYPVTAAVGRSTYQGADALERVGD